MRPVGFVQGYCVMRWSWYQRNTPSSTRGFWGYRGAPIPNGERQLSNYYCPHYPVPKAVGADSVRSRVSDHRFRGVNVDQSTVTKVWREGYDKAVTRMRSEAALLGAHGVIGVIDRASHLVDGQVMEFHMSGTAVVVDDTEVPDEIWTSYLGGQRLAKLLDAGLFPVSVVATMASVRLWAGCWTENLMSGGTGFLGPAAFRQEISQIADALMQARRLARDQVRERIGHDDLHGVSIEGGWREISEGDLELHCAMRATRVRRVADAPRLAAPVPTVTLR
jgi:uncharacterized protein YbjQ (UPF0145 family)